MQKLPLYLYSLAGILCLTIGFGILTANRASGQFPVFVPGGKVKVTNKATEPVPVKIQGTSNGLGTVKIDTAANTVKIDTAGNTVKAAQEGTWNVSLTGTPTVQLSTTNPIPVNDVSNQVGQPVQIAFGNNSGVIYTVPAGKRLIIEHVSGFLRSPSGTNVVVHAASMRTVVGGVLRSHYFPLTGLSVDFNGDQVAVFSQEIRAYAESGTDVELAPIGAIIADYTVSGRLVDAP